MRIGILYGCKEKLSNAHKLVSTLTQPPKRSASSKQGKSDPLAQPPYYVRLDTVISHGVIGLDDALGLAKPMPGETVLNTVWL